MATTFDATLKDMGRESPLGFLATFDQPPALPVKPLNVDLSTVTALADLVLGIGRLWERPAEDLLRAELGVAPLAVLGRLPGNLSLEDGLTVIAQRLAERITKEAPPERARKLLTDAYLLTGLRLRRDAAARIFRGARVMHESDTYLAILDEGQEKATRESILLFGEGQFGPPDESVKAELTTITDLARLKRMVSRAVTARNWREILETP